MVQRFKNRALACEAAIFISLVGLMKALDHLLEDWNLSYPELAPFSRVAVICH